MKIQNSNQQTKVVTDWGHHTPPQWFQSNRGLTEIPDSDSQRRGRGSMWMKESCTNCKIKLPKCREGSMASCFSFHIQPKKEMAVSKQSSYLQNYPLSQNVQLTHAFTRNLYSTMWQLIPPPQEHWPPTNTDLQQYWPPTNTDRQKINYWLIN